MRPIVVGVSLALASPLLGQSLLYRSPNLGGTWVPEVGVLQFNFVHRFFVTPAISGAPHAVINFPTFTLAVGLPGQLTLGMRYATNATSGSGKNETELYGRWRREIGAEGALAIAVTPAYNTSAKSMDGEVSVDWTIGSITVLGAVRGMSKAYGVDTMRVALAGGAVVRLNSYVGLAGDFASLLSTRGGEKAAWSAGLVFAIPNSPHTFSLHASNVSVNTIQGSSKKTAAISSKPIYGFEFTIPIHLSRFGAWFRKTGAAAVTGDVDAPVAGTVTIGAMKYRSDTIEIAAGQAVRWNNADPLGHTITFDQASGESSSSLIPPNGSYIHRFTKPGTYAYQCTPHPFMKGVVVVK